MASNQIATYSQHISNSQIAYFRRNIVKWFSNNGREFPWRRANSTNYQKIVAELLLQRTRAETVASFYPQFLALYPSWKRLAAAKESDLKEVLKPIGLWRKRANSMKQLARKINELHRIPTERENVEALPGVGQYVGNAIMLLVNKETVPLVDVNTSRVLERYFGPRTLVDIRFDPYLQELAKRVVVSRNPISVNWAILDLGALTCTVRKPDCIHCPLRNRCWFLNQSDE